MEQYIERIAVHSVGNKANGDAILLSSSELMPDESIRNLLATYFLSPFKSEEYYNLYHESSLELNEAYNFVSRIFDDPQALHEQSVQLAKHLYEQSNHPKIKGGEFYVVYFTDCPLHGETVNAVGLFKSENKDTFLKISASAAASTTAPHWPNMRCCARWMCPTRTRTTPHWKKNCWMPSTLPVLAPRALAVPPPAWAFPLSKSPPT